MRVKVLLFSISLVYLCECARLGADFLLALSCPQPTSCSSWPRSSMPCHVVVHSALTVGQDSVVVPFNVVRAMLYGPCSRHHAYCSAISFIPFSHSFSRDLLFFFFFSFCSFGISPRWCCTNNRSARNRRRRCVSWRNLSATSSQGHSTTTATGTARSTIGRSSCGMR